MTEKKTVRKPRKIRHRELVEHIRQHKGLFVLYMVLRALVILVLIAQLLDRNYENVFLCALTLMLFTIPSVVEIRMDIDIPVGIAGHHYAFYLRGGKFWGRSINTI